MDVTFTAGERKFNYRVAAVFLHEGKLLAMKDQRSPYYYLPGGRVLLGETAEDAVRRELREELGLAPAILRPLWLNQAFFTEDVDGLRYHELCLYFLMEVPGALLARGERFDCREGERTHAFCWLAIERLAEEYFYPVFLKTEIFRLPERFTLRTELE